MALTPGSLTTVAVKSAGASTINWMQWIGIAAHVVSFFGLDVSPQEQAAIQMTIGVAVKVATFVARTWFSKSVLASST